MIIKSFKSVLVVLFLVGMTALATSVFAEDPSLKELEDQAFGLYKNKQYDQATVVTQKALKIAEQQFGRTSLEAAKFLGNLGWLYRLQDKEAEAKINLDKALAIRKQHGTTGVPLGIQTEAFFDEVDKRKGEAWKPGDVQGIQMGSDKPLCDLDGDGDCDEDDHVIFKKALGHCNDTIYAENAAMDDINSDGCINELDEQILFGRTIKPVILNDRTPQH